MSALFVPYAISFIAYMHVQSGDIPQGICGRECSILWKEEGRVESRRLIIQFHLTVEQVQVLWGFVVKAKTVNVRLSEPDNGFICI